MNTMPKRTEHLLTTHGLGHMNFASGTWGSMPPVIIAFGLISAGIAPGTSLSWIYYLVFAIIFIVYCSTCILSGHLAEAKWGKDPSEVVADETAGQAITLMMIPAGVCNCPYSTLMVLAIAFFFFRAFDVLKPWPAGAMQKIAGGWGILLDDIFAGIMAGIALLIIVNILPFSPAG